MSDGASRVPWDQRLARQLVRPLLGTRLHPNHLTLLTIVLALAAGALFASGGASSADWGAGLFVLSRFLDHLDGELARQSGQSTRLGYVLDYLAGGVSYAALFAGIAIGLARGPLGGYAIALGLLGVASALIAVLLNMRVDRLRGTGVAVGYPAAAGFELEDGIYLLAPVTWLGWLAPFFVLAAIGAGVYLAWTARVLARCRALAAAGRR